MSSSIDVAIIGAGPYGLSLSAYLSASGVEFRTFGRPMEPWKLNMPPGMLLKSHPWSSSLYDPGSHFTLKHFCAERGISYHDSLMPLPLETYIAYGEAFQERLVPRVEGKLLAALEPILSGFRATFDDGEVVIARHVVVAVGVHPFKHVPTILSHLPAEFLSHSGDYGSLDAFEGKDVIVLGSGASAIDIAALVHEKGASVRLVARASELRFAKSSRVQRSLLKQLVDRLRQLARPNSGIGDTWVQKICADAPWLIHALPERYRIHLVRTTLGPLGGAPMKDRVIGKFPTLLQRTLDSAEIRRGKVHLHIAKQDGTKDIIRSDHIIAGTGYRIDVRKLGFLDSSLLERIRTVENAPVLDLKYEASVPGLYFIGPATANSFGPVARFAFGAKHPAEHLTRHLSKALAKRSTSNRLRSEAARGGISI